MRFRLRAAGVEATLRIFACALGAAGRHALGRLGDVAVSAPRVEARRAARRARTTTRVVALLGDLKGAFVKAGQFASMRHDLVSAEAAEALVSLRNQVPPIGFEQIRAVVEADLGRPLAALFAEFEPEPLGAASMAQVHRARLPGGATVAVKVQYPWVGASLRSDVSWLRRLVQLLSWWGKREIPDRDRLFEEFERGLVEELDFEREGRIAAEIAANLSHDPQIVVPEIVETHSSRRVLTMTCYDTIPITDRAALERVGARPAAVLEIIARAYAKQIFADGLFHADPHPGNLFLIDEPTAGERPRVLFVDFGLSRRLSPELRTNLRLGIYALLQGDVDAFVGRMDAMQMITPGATGPVRDAVRAMFERIRESGGGLGMAGSAVLGLKDEAKALLRETPGLQLPNDLLLYARTLTYLFALGEELDPDVDLLKLSTPYLLRFLAATG